MAMKRIASKWIDCDYIDEEVRLSIEYERVKFAMGQPAGKRTYGRCDHASECGLHIADCRYYQREPEVVPW